MAKKNFIYFIKSSNPRRNGGGVVEKADIYQIKKNEPVYVDDVEWNTASYKGAKSEVFTKLKERGLVPKRDFDKNRGYHLRSNDTKIFQL